MIISFWIVDVVLVERTNQEDTTDDPVVTDSQGEFVENQNDALPTVTQNLEDIKLTVDDQATATPAEDEEKGLLLHLHFIK